MGYASHLLFFPQSTLFILHFKSIPSISLHPDYLWLRILEWKFLIEILYYFPYILGVP